MIEKRALQFVPAETRHRASVAVVADKPVGSPRYPASTPLNHRRSRRGDLSKATLSWRCPMIAQFCVLPLHRTLRAVSFWLGNTRRFQLSRDVALVRCDERSSA